MQVTPDVYAELESVLETLTSSIELIHKELGALREQNESLSVRIDRLTQDTQLIKSTQFYNLA